MHRIAVTLLATILVVGCGSKATTNSTPAAPEDAMYEKVRGARYQIAVANDRLAEMVSVARGLAEPEEGDVREALHEIASDLADAGSKLAEFEEPPPPLEKFKAAFAEQDELRLQAIAAADEARQLVQESLDITEDLLGSSPPQDVKTSLTQMKSGILEAKEAIEEAISDMGGAVSGS